MNILYYVSSYCEYMCVFVTSNYYKFVLVLIYVFTYTYTYAYMYIYIHTSIRERHGVYAIYITYLIYTLCIRLQHTHADARSAAVGAGGGGHAVEFATNYTDI
jgi:hypothetical protein